MRLVSTIINPKLKLGFLLLFGSLTAGAQENSPFSRYGLGDIYPGQNIVNRGMGGLSTAYIEGQSVNFSNPASYSGHKMVTFDVGVSIDSRNLKSTNPVQKYSAINFLPSYVAVAMPLSKKRDLGFAFGLRPVSTINYAISQRTRLRNIDSVVNLYEGNGGLYQLYGGLGKRWGGLRVGFNAGFTFGRKETGTRVIFIPDSLDTEYALSNSSTTTTYGKGFVNGGLQYEFKVGKKSMMRFGFNANLKQTLNAKQDLLRETFTYDGGGATIRIDSVFESKDSRGTIELPATYTAGVIFQTFAEDQLKNRVEKSSIGIEFETAKWSEFKFYKQADRLNDLWMVRVGGQLTPNPLGVTSYWNRVNFRAGFNIGRDFVSADGKELPVRAVTFGMGLPIRNWRGYGSTQSTVINTSIEVGKRGNKNNNVTESYFRLSFGLALSDVGWFYKRKYD
jgi:hypothetical protein